MKNKEVIINYSHGWFNPDVNLKEFLKSLGYEGWFELKARTDERVIDFIKNRGLVIDGEYYYQGEIDNYSHNGAVTIEKVDISRPWRISEYDGAEGVQYLDYEVIDKELNYCQLKENE